MSNDDRVLVDVRALYDMEARLEQIEQTLRALRTVVLRTELPIGAYTTEVQFALEQLRQAEQEERNADR